jgi:hypothetical protein
VTITKVVIAQKGSREHFLAARALHRRGMLAQMVVDWYAPLGSATRFLGHSRWRALSRAFSARTQELPEDMITALNFVGFKDRIRGHIARRIGSVSEATLQSDIQYASAVARAPLPEHDVFFGFSYASLEALEAEKERGKLCILDQIDPGEMEYEIIRDEQHRWPLYVASPMEVSRAYFDRLKKEWLLADAIIVNSEWSRDCNIARGAPAEKIEVVPLAYESNGQVDSVNRRAGHPCRILWVGRVTLQKGIQYLVEAARLLADKPVEFLICGDVAITSKAMAAAPENMRWLGKATFSQKSDLYDSATAFVLPTVSDGFAITQLAAFAHGLPVIVTPNCGKVVADGVTGFVVPPRDPVALAGAISRFIDDPDLPAKMSPRCLEAVQAFSIDTYGHRLAEIIDKHMQRRQRVSQTALIS